VVDPNTREESNLWKGFAENSITKNGPGNPPSEVNLPEGFPCVADEIRLDPSEVPIDFWEEVERVGYITREMTQQYDLSYPLRLSMLTCKCGKLVQPCKVFSGWANVNKLREFIDNGCQPVTEPDGDKVSFYLSERGVIYYRRERMRARNILSVLRNMGTTEQMRSELEKLNLEFQYPKPKQLLSYLLQIGLEDGDVVLDFFAGSATLGHSLIELSRKGVEGKRYILVQLPEPVSSSASRNNGARTVADIGKERIRRVIKKMKAERENDLISQSREMPEDLGFRVFKLDQSHYMRWTGTAEKDADELVKQMELSLDPLIPGWKPEDVLWEIAIKEGLSLTSQIEKVQGIQSNIIYRITDEDKDQSLLVCLDNVLKPETPRALNLEKETRFFCRDIALTDELAANLALQCRLKTI
jgi:adenine-specific DNA-methyltransferase